MAGGVQEKDVGTRRRKMEHDGQVGPQRDRLPQQQDVVCLQWARKPCHQAAAFVLVSRNGQTGGLCAYTVRDG